MYVCYMQHCNMPHTVTYNTAAYHTHSVTGYLLVAAVCIDQLCTFVLQVLVCKPLPFLLLLLLGECPFGYRTVMIQEPSPMHLMSASVCVCCVYQGRRKRKGCKGFGLCII